MRRALRLPGARAIRAWYHDLADGAGVARELRSKGMTDQAKAKRQTEEVKDEQELTEEELKRAQGGSSYNHTPITQQGVGNARPR